MALKRILLIPSYPQDKGKVERCIQNLNREFINLLRKTPKCLNDQLGDYRNWFNYPRYHLGVKAHPAELYECKVDMTVGKILNIVLLNN